MSTPRRLAEIPGARFLGRPVRPFHIGVGMACFALSALQWTDSTPLAASSWGDWLGAFAAAATVLLAVGWWGRSDRLAEYGLLLAAGVWAERAAAVLLTGSSTTGAAWLSAVLSAAWSVSAAGAYWLERADHHARTRNGAGVVMGE